MAQYDSGRHAGGSRDDAWQQRDQGDSGRPQQEQSAGSRHGSGQQLGHHDTGMSRGSPEQYDDGVGQYGDAGHGRGPGGAGGRERGDAGGYGGQGSFGGQAGRNDGGDGQRAWAEHHDQGGVRRGGPGVPGRYAREDDSRVGWGGHPGGSAGYGQRDGDFPGITRSGDYGRVDPGGRRHGGGYAESGRDDGRYSESRHDERGRGGLGGSSDWEGGGRLYSDPYRGGAQDGFGGGSPEWRSGHGGMHHDPDYHQWRTEQMRKLDQEYDEWRKHRYQRFSNEFNEWRSQRDRGDAAQGGTAAGGSGTASTSAGGSGTGSASGGSSAGTSPDSAAKESKK